MASPSEPSISSVETSSESSSHSSSTTTKILDRYSCRTGPVPYGFHPVCDRRDRSPTVSSSESVDSGPSEFPLSPDDGPRIGTTEWCSCGNCGPMLTSVESLCCQEVAAILHRMPEGSGSAPVAVPSRLCVTDANDFAPVCINRAVLEVGLLSMYDLRADSLIQPIASR